MKQIIILSYLLCFAIASSVCQTPINLSAQSGLTYTENFADINNWVFNISPANGTFTAGIGSQAWKGIDATTSTPAIPNATRITHLTNFFQTSNIVGGIPTYSSGFYKATQSATMISTGPSDNTSSVAMDFFLDFTGVVGNAVIFTLSKFNLGREPAVPPLAL